MWLVDQLGLFNNGNIITAYHIENIFPLNRIHLPTELILWEAATGHALRTYNHDNYTIATITFYPDGRRALAGDSGGNLFVWKIEPFADDLYTWAAQNRYIPELTCEQRAMFSLEVRCEAGEALPTHTPVMVSSPAPTWTPILTATVPMWTPIPTLTPLAPLRITLGTVVMGENHGNLEQGTADFWQYEGLRGERLSIEVEADFPVKLTLQRETGLVLAVSDVGMLTEVELLRDGLYDIIVEGVDRQSNGTYVLLMSTIQQ